MDWLIFLGSLAVVIAFIAAWRIGMSRWIAARMRAAETLDSFDKEWLEAYENKHRHAADGWEGR